MNNRGSKRLPNRSTMAKLWVYHSEGIADRKGASYCELTVTRQIENVSRIMMT